MHGGRFHHICQGKYRADKVDWQHGTEQCDESAAVPDRLHPKLHKGGLRHSRQGYGPRKNGCAGSCFPLPFPARACSMFPAARGKAAGMLTLRELKNIAETAPSGQKTPTARELRSSGKLIAERKIGESAGIAAYRNGQGCNRACSG